MPSFPFFNDDDSCSSNNGGGGGSDEVLNVVDGQKDTCSRMLRVRLYIARPVRLPCSQTMASSLRTLFKYPFQARRRRPRRSLRLSAWLFWRLHSSSSPCALAVASSAGARTRSVQRVAFAGLRVQRSSTVSLPDSGHGSQCFCISKFWDQLLDI